MVHERHIKDHPAQLHLGDNKTSRPIVIPKGIVIYPRGYSRGYVVEEPFNAVRIPKKRINGLSAFESRGPATPLYNDGNHITLNRPFGAKLGTIKEKRKADLEAEKLKKEANEVIPF